MRSSYYSKRFFHATKAFLLDDLSSWQIYEFKVALSINHEILRLDISANNRFLGEILKNENN